MTPRIPSYRHHKARNLAVVTINGKDHYLGPYESPQSREKYHRLIAEWLGGQELREVPRNGTPSLSVNELILRYYRFACSYYVKNGQPTSEVATIKQALRFVRQLYGSVAAVEFSPKALKAVQNAMIEHAITTKRNGEIVFLRKGLTRKLINKQIQRIRRMFAWAVEEELLPVVVHQALLRVRGLRKGKTAAREKPRIRPVLTKVVEATLPFAPPVIRTMIQVQFLMAGRPQDVVLMRPADIDTSKPVWEYRPPRHKTEHHNQDGDPDLDRVIYLGPQAQVLLRPYMTVEPEFFLFCPRRSEAVRSLVRRELRQTPMWPSHMRSKQDRRAKPRKRAPRERYDVGSYRKAIQRACRRAGMPVWSPNQLRHSRLSDLRRRYGLEAAKACAGQREITVTQHYAEQDRGLAYKAMQEVG
jgi:integrase